MATVIKRTWTDAKGRAKEAWRIAYTDADGVRRKVQKATKREADAYRIKVEGEVSIGVHTPDATSVTVAAAAAIWVAAAEAGGCDRATLKGYREIVRGHIVPLIGAEKLSRLTGPKVVAYRDSLMATRSHAMATKAIRHLSMILGEGVQRGLCAQNVARGVKVKAPRADKKQGLAKRADIPPIEHLRAMIEAADRLGNSDPRLPVMVRTAMLTGMRASEMRGFPWPNADLANGLLRVTQRADRWNEIGVPKSDAGTRAIPIGPELVTALKAWKLRCPPSPTNLLFPNRPRGRQWPSSAGQTHGGPIKQHTMAALLLKVQIAAGIALDSGKRTSDGETVWKLRYDWHHLRHVAASHWIDQGVDLKRLQVWIGHENVQLTIDVYGHLMADGGRDASMAAGAEAALLA